MPTWFDRRIFSSNRSYMPRFAPLFSLLRRLLWFIMVSVPAYIASAFAGEVVYFVLTDRFEDGDVTNNTAGLSAAAAGFDKRSEKHFHGGDFRGIQQRLDYLENLGVTALWLTPVFRNKPVQDGSAAYHGYWIIDFLNVDPHLGSNEDFRNLVRAAHARGIKVYLDIVVNHTADVIFYAENSYSYRNKTDFPFRRADGSPFDDRDYVWRGPGSPVFPTLSPTVSFAYTPRVSPAERDAKNPAWLNDLTHYHNRGNSTFSGESSIYGDFMGLDDLFTTRPEVVSGMIEIFQYWIREYGIDGFRIDTVKHVNLEFWQQFIPAIRAEARLRGIDHFFQFGEVFSGDPGLLSAFQAFGYMDATLDFGFAFAARDYLSRGQSAQRMIELFARDELYRLPHTDAAQQPVFLGNHDFGRWGHFVRADNPTLNEQDILQVALLGHALTFFARGPPVIYYGDEQGFVGGADSAGREDMMPSQVTAYNRLNLIGTQATTAAANFDTQHPLFQAIRTMAEVYRQHAALAGGIQQTREQSAPEVLAFSRWSPQDRHEYLVVFNNHRSQARNGITVQTWYSAHTEWDLLYSNVQMPASLSGSANGTVSFNLPRLSVAVYRSRQPVTVLSAQVNLLVRDEQVLGFSPWEQDGHRFPGRVALSASVQGSGLQHLRFYVTRSSDPHNEIFAGETWTAPWRIALPVFSDWQQDETLDIRLSVAGPPGAPAQNFYARAVSLQEGFDPRYLVIHHHRSDGNYNDWVLRAEGNGVAESAVTTPFMGRTAFGAFAFVRIVDPMAPVCLQIGRRQGEALTQTLFAEPHQVVPARRYQFWTLQNDARLHRSAASARGAVRIHFRRPSGSTNGYQLELAGGTRLNPVGSSSFGIYFDVQPLHLRNFSDWSQPLSFTVRNPQNQVVDGVERFLKPADSSDFWLVEGDYRVHLSRAASENVVVIHYHRPDGQYGNAASNRFEDFWGIHLWEGAAQPNPSWQSPKKPDGSDAFGIGFRIPLQPNATRLAYILHRGELKDPGPDQFVQTAVHGHEVWQISGAAAESPYVLHSGPDTQPRGPNAATIAHRMQPFFHPGNQSLHWFALSGFLYRVEQSTNLMDWVPVRRDLSGADAWRSVEVESTAHSWWRIIAE